MNTHLEPTLNARTIVLGFAIVVLQPFDIIRNLPIGG